MRRRGSLGFATVLVVLALLTGGCSATAGSGDASQSSIMTAGDTDKSNIDLAVNDYIRALAALDVAAASRIHEGGFSMDLSRASAFGRYASDSSSTFYFGPVMDEKVVGPGSKPTGWLARALVAVTASGQVHVFTIALSGSMGDHLTVSGASVDSSAR